jgi:hypothetical protein
MAKSENESTFDSMRITILKTSWVSAQILYVRMIGKRLCRAMGNYMKRCLILMTARI